VLIIYTFLIGTFKVSFISLGWSIPWDFIDDYCLDWIFTLDIILNFFTPVWRDHQLVISLPKIWCNYLRLPFWLDLLSVFPFEILLQSSDLSTTGNSVISLPRLVKIFRFFRLLRINKIKRMDSRTMLKRLLYYKKSITSFVGMMVVMMIEVFLCVHVMTCLFFAISQNSNDTKSWLYS